MANTENFALEEGSIRVIGPQIGLNNKPGTVLITIALTQKDAPKKISCLLSTDSGEDLHQQNCQPVDETFNNFLFEFNNLTADTKYNYKFLDQKGQEIPLEGGLSYADCWFYGPTFHNETDKFVLLSCNNPFQSGEVETESQFAMWKRLNKRIGTNKEIRLIIQGGDQVYNDQIEKRSLGLLQGKDKDSATRAEVTDQIIWNYQRFYADLNYRRIMARIPSVAMLDDHDITDGWGGRDDSVDKNNEFKLNWKAYFELTYAAFQALQAVKNPAPIYASAATTYLDIGDNRIFLMDYRAEKNSFKKMLISPDHEEKVLDLIRSTDKRIIFLSPVVPARINPEFEEGMGRFTKWAHEVNEHLKEKLDKRKLQLKKLEWWTKTLRFFYVTTGAIAAYSDDIYDSLSSEGNKPYFLNLMATFRDTYTQYKKEVLILSGDIHTGGISEIFIQDTDLVIPQIVSSPIGYEPMNKVVKGVTTTEDDQCIVGESIKVGFRNIFFRSDRNFAIITPSRLRKQNGVEFHFEHLSKPIFSPAYFS